MTTLTDRANVYDANGYLTASGVEVAIEGDTVAIGRASYPASELKIDAAAGRIDSPNGWSVEWS